MGKRRITASDVAKRAGVSQTTVSFVLNRVDQAGISEETRRRVLAAAEDLHYVPNAAAQALVRGRTQTIGLVFAPRDRHLVSHFFLLQFMDGLLDLVRQQRLRLLVDTAGEGEEEDAYSSLARAKHIDGLIIIEPRSDDTGLRAMIEDAFPVVLVGSLPDVETCCIDVDNRAAARAAVEHLQALGHTRIACITNAPLSYMSAAQRLLGYQDALAAAGIPLDETLVRYGKHTPESGFSRMNSLLGENVLPTAVFVASDVVAVGAIKAVKQAGLQIPEDLAVVGFDDIPLAAYLDPPLTTVHTSVYDMGWGAGEMLVRLIAREEEIRDSQVILDTELIVRKSCGARRGAD